MTTASTSLVGFDSTSSGFNPTTHQPAIPFELLGDRMNSFTCVVAGHGITIDFNELTWLRRP